VVHPWRGRLAAVEPAPAKGRLFHAQRPHVVKWICPFAAAEQDQVGLGEEQRVAVPASRCRAYYGHDHPLGLFLPVAHVEEVEVVVGEGATACAAAEDHHLHLFDVCRGMCGAR